MRLFCHHRRLFLLVCPGILSRDSAWLAWIRPNKYAGICSSFIRCQNRIRQSMHQKQPIHHTLILSGCKENQSKCYIETDKYMNNKKSTAQSKITAEISNKDTGCLLHLYHKCLFYFVNTNHKMCPTPEGCNQSGQPCPQPIYQSVCPVPFHSCRRICYCPLPVTVCPQPRQQEHASISPPMALFNQCSPPWTENASKLQ